MNLEALTKKEMDCVKKIKPLRIQRSWDHWTAIYTSIKCQRGAIDSNPFAGLSPQELAEYRK
jgi:hypothetical protein